MRTVALVSPGGMGQAVGALLARGASALVRESELLLSIVPPAQAVAVARATEKVPTT